MEERKPLTEMSDEELTAELERMNSIKPPSDRRPAAPRAKRDVKTKTRARGWRGQLFED